MDNPKSDTVSLKLNTYIKQEICASRAPELILKNMCAISSEDKSCIHTLFFFVVVVVVVFLSRYTF